jgi:LuxR family transcriptional regulator, maltose regulon positive regulatory protein
VSPTLGRRGGLHRVLRWLERLPEAVRREQPQLNLWYALALFLAGRTEESRQPLDATEEAWRSRGDEARLGNTAAVRAYAESRQGDYLRTIAHAEDALSRMPEDELFLRSLASYALGITRQATGDLPGALTAMQASRLASEQAGNAMICWLGSAALGEIAIMQGRLRLAAETYGEVLAHQEGKPLLPRIEAYVHLGDLYREWNDFAEAKRLLHQALLLVEQAHWEPLMVQRYSLLARLALARMEPSDEAAPQFPARLDRPDPLDREAGRIAFDRQATAFYARLKLSTGDIATATHWAAESGLMLDDEIPFERELEYLVWARTLTAQGRVEEAIRLLDRLIASAEGARRLGYTIEMLALQALAAWAAGNEDQALASLARALLRAEPEGYVRTFVDEGRPMAALLHEAAARGITPDYTRQLLAAFAAGDAPTASRLPQTVALIEPLSERELEVLRLVASGASNQDIAAQLSIALTTAKKHISNILHKLGAGNRTEVVARGRDLGLLS